MHAEVSSSPCRAGFPKLQADFLFLSKVLSFEFFVYFLFFVYNLQFFNFLGEILKALILAGVTGRCTFYCKQRAAQLHSWHIRH